MSDGGGNGGDNGGKKPVKERHTFLWYCCNCRIMVAMVIESTPACLSCYHYRCSSCPVEKLRDTRSRSLSKKSRKTPVVAPMSDSGTSLATPVAAGVAAKIVEYVNASDIYGAERFLMSLRSKRRLLGRGSKGFTRDEIFSALSKAVEGNSPCLLLTPCVSLQKRLGLRRVHTPR
jgi:hypothetical protein